MSTVRLLTLAMLVIGLTAQATLAQDHKIARVGLLALDEHECGNEPLRSGLRELGYVEGGNFVIECRHGGGRYEGLTACRAGAGARASPTSSLR